MAQVDEGYILTELWNAKPAWLALSAAERRSFFEDKIHPFMAGLIEQGGEFMGAAVNDNTGTERIDYDYMAIWKLPDKEFSDRLEAGAKALGFLEYFEQANSSGTIVSGQALDEVLIGLT
jgi:hypothetical protein